MRVHLRNVLVAGTAIQCATFFSGVMVARLLGPESRGAFGIIFLWPFLASTIAMCSLNDAASYLILNRKLEPSRAYGAALFLGLIGSVLCIGLFFAILLLSPYGADNNIPFLMFLFSTISVPHNITLIAGSVFLAKSNQRYWNIVRVWAHIAYAAGIFVLYFHGSSMSNGLQKLEIVTIISLAANWSGVPVCLLMLRAIHIKMQMPLKGEIVLTAKTALQIHFGNVPQIIAGFMDQIVFAVSLSIREYGVILVASAVVRAGLFITSGLSQSMTPRLYGHANRRATSNYFSSGIVLLLVASGYMLVFDLISFIAIPIIYGAHYDEAKFFLLILSCQIVLLPLRSLLLNALRAVGRHSMAAAVEWTNIVVVILIVPFINLYYGAYWGLVGLIFASLVTCVAGLTLYLRLMRPVRRSGLFIALAKLRASLPHSFDASER